MDNMHIDVMATDIELPAFNLQFYWVCRFRYFIDLKTNFTLKFLKNHLTLKKLERIFQFKLCEHFWLSCFEFIEQMTVPAALLYLQWNTTAS